MKWLITTLLLFWFVNIYGIKKSIELIPGVTIYLTEDSLNHSEFNSLPVKSRIGEIFFIDNRIVFGTDFEIPKTKLTSAYVEFDNKKVNLEVSYMYSPNIQSITSKNFKTEKVGDKLIINGLFSDGAGVFFVQWIVCHSTSSRSIITNNESVYIKLFYAPDNQIA